MSDTDTTDMANTAVMLNEAVEKRIAAALLNILYGMSAKDRWGEDEYDPIKAHEYVKIGIMSMLIDDLKTLIRQEIVNAFSDPNSDCTRTVTTGDTIRISTDFTVT